VLCPGDEVFIPERARKEVGAKAGEVTRLKVMTPERRVLLTVLDGEDRPLADEPFVIEGGEAVVTGTTDGAGGLDAALPASVRWARLDVGGLTWKLDLGGLDPIEGAPDGGRAGVSGRLSNLGYDPGLVGEDGGDRLRMAMRGFELDHGVERSPDDEGPSRKKLEEVHGC
jgi:N-acetylmuramoyl-L-alanine amidase